MKGSDESDTHGRSVDETLVGGKRGFKRFMIASNESNRLLQQECTSLQHSDTHHYVTLSFLCASLLHGRHNKEANRDVGGGQM